jgi:hypothetical protein
MKLIKYSDGGAYSYFWINSEDNIISPIFSLESEAVDWMEEVIKEYNKKFDLDLSS